MASTGQGSYLGLGDIELRTAGVTNLKTENITGTLVTATTIEVDVELLPTNDNTAVLGNRSKRFKRISADEINSVRIVNDIDAPAIASEGIRQKQVAATNVISNLVVEAVNTGAISACALVGSTLVAVGYTGTTAFKCYTCAAPGTGTWTSKNVSITSGTYVPNWLCYSPTAGVVAAFDSNSTTSNYYTCVTSDYDLWTLRSLPASMAVQGAAFLGGYFVVFATDMIYTSPDAITWTQMTNFTVSAAGASFRDIIERPDYDTDDIDRFLLLTTGVGATANIWCANSILGPFQPRSKVYATATTMRAMLYNPYYKTLLIHDSSTGQPTVFDYLINTTTELSAGTLATGLTLNASQYHCCQNHNYINYLRCHLYSLRSLPTNFQNNAVIWNGKKATDCMSRILLNSSSNPNTNSSTIFGIWSVDQANLYVYAAMKHGGDITNNVYGTSFMTISRISLAFPDPLVSDSTNNQFENLTTSTRVRMDKYDRYISLSSDPITGGVGSAYYPVKQINFSEKLNSQSVNSSIAIRGYKNANVLGNINSDLIVTGPAASGRRSCVNIKNHVWSASTVSVASNTSAIVTRVLGPSSETKLNRLFALCADYQATPYVNIKYSTNGDLSFTALTPIQIQSEGIMDISYSPNVSTYVFTSSSTTNSSPDSYYSTDAGTTWTKINLDQAVTSGTQFGISRWIADYADCGMFLLFATVNTATASSPSQTIFISQSGKNFQAVPNITQRMRDAGAASTRHFINTAYDPARKYLAVSLRHTSSGASNTSSAVFYTADGYNWSTAGLTFFNYTFIINTTNNKIDWTPLTCVNSATLDSGTYTPSALAAHIDSKINNVSTIDSTNCNITFKVNGGSNFLATLTTGVYTPDTLAAEAQLRMRAISSDSSITVTWNVSTYTFTFANSTTLQLMWTTGSNVARREFGFSTQSAAASSITGTSIRITVSWFPTSTTPAFRFTRSFNTIKILWSTGPNTLTSVGTTLNFNVASDSSFASNITGTNFVPTATHYKIAYSPALDRWVAAGGGPSIPLYQYGINALNLYYSTDITSGVWTAVDVYQNGTGTPKPNFLDVVWVETLQMFLLLNSNTAYTGTASTDSPIWYSLNGINFYSMGHKNVTNLSFLNTFQYSEYTEYQLSFDTLNGTLCISDGVDRTDVYIYPFNISTSTLTFPNWQWGLYTPTTNVTTSGVTYTVPFNQTYTSAPTAVTVSPMGTSSDRQFTWVVSNITTSTFDLTCYRTQGTDGTGITFVWMAWNAV